MRSSYREGTVAWMRGVGSRGRGVDRYWHTLQEELAEFANKFNMMGTEEKIERN